MNKLKQLWKRLREPMVSKAKHDEYIDYYHKLLGNSWKREKKLEKQNKKLRKLLKRFYEER